MKQFKKKMIRKSHGNVPVQENSSAVALLRTELSRVEAERGRLEADLCARTKSLKTLQAEMERMRASCRDKSILETEDFELAESRAREEELKEQLEQSKKREEELKEQLETETKEMAILELKIKQVRKFFKHCRTDRVLELFAFVSAPAPTIFPGADYGFREHTFFNCNEMS